MQARLVEQVAAETATGFKAKLATKRISSPRLARYFNRRVWQGIRPDSVGPPGRG